MSEGSSLLAVLIGVDHRMKGGDSTAVPRLTEAQEVCLAPGEVLTTRDHGVESWLFIIGAPAVSWGAAPSLTHSLAADGGFRNS